MHEPVCAVVVTFHPGHDVLRNLALVMAQAQRLVVVDNGSGAASLKMLREASAERGFALIENRSNLGIAAALNRGVRQALAEGYGWVVLFDQDSTVGGGFLDAMFWQLDRDPRRGRVAVVCPRYVDRDSGRLMIATRTRDGEIAVARTSGSLMPAWVFAECGWFVEELLIDQVDYEYCLRLRSRGYLIAECAGATLRHTLGAPSVHRLFGVRLFGTTNHSAARRYYLVRNRMWMLRRYWGEFPRWCVDACVATVKESVKILLVEDCRWSKLRHTALGVRDGVLGRMGKTVEL
jgi:rhamnosyltransferase